MTLGRAVEAKAAALSSPKVIPILELEELSSKSAEIVCEKKTVLDILDRFNYLSKEQKSAVVGICGVAL
jgi:hypothetical protein